jgi:hypothetical protein
MEEIPNSRRRNSSGEIRAPGRHAPRLFVIVKSVSSIPSMVFGRDLVVGADASTRSVVKQRALGLSLRMTVSRIKRLRAFGGCLGTERR